MYVAVSQRVVVDPVHGVRHDALDQRWWAFLGHCGLMPLPVPNDVEAARGLVADLPVRGIVLTGGNDLGVCGGDAPERDATEAVLVESALRLGLPLLGVCRGMQVLQHHFGIPLQRVPGHVRTSQTLRVNSSERVVNSYHHWAATETRPPLRQWAVAPDGVVEGVRHETAPLLGIMWHPERIAPIAEEDVALFREHFGAAA